MAKKEISGYVKLQIKGGQANPAPPVGPALGQRGINIMEFCKAFNDKTKALAGKPVPVIITGIGFPANDFVLSLKALQNSIILIPLCPNAGPTGGAGFACPPLICNFIYPLISFAINLPSQLGYTLSLLE